MACVYSIDGGNTYISEKDFKDYLKNNLEDLVSSKEIDFSKFSGVIPKESVKVITQPTNESELATMLEKRFGRNPELARAEAKLFDLRASVWSDLTGNSKEDFYSRVSYGDEKSADGLNQIIGEQGASRLENAEMVLADLNVAREMEKAGKTPKEIHLATSWERGSDGKWRFEVPDAEFKGKLGSVENLRTYPFGLNKTFELGDIVDSELLKAYPELKKMDVVFVTDVSYNGVFESYQDSKKNRIKIAIKKNNWQSILLHEIQHAIQNIEGFKDVRSEKNITESQRFKLIEYSQRYKELYNKLIEGNATKSEIEEIEDIEYDWKKDSEVEARNVQTRMNMTPEERKLKMLSETEDVAREHQIIIQNALQQKSDEGLNQMELPDGRSVEVKPINADVVNGFYSPLEKTINETKLDKLPVKQWIDKFGKGEEAKWTGLSDWLGQQQGSVSKADIQKFLKDNRVQIVEVVKGEVEEPFTGWSLDDIENHLIDNMGADEEEVKGMSRREMVEWAKENADYDYEEPSATKFSQYQLEGEKENYKEVLVTLPKQYTYKHNVDKTKIVDDGNFWSFYDLDNELITSFSKRTNPTKEDAINNFKITFRLEKNSFKSTHFEEPNILVHLRMNTRTDSDGKKVLFLEEVQSDWGQQGKKEGFEIKEEDRWNFEPIKRNNEIVAWKIELKSDKNIGGIGNTKEDAIKDANRRYGVEINALEKQAKGVPTAPFVMDTNAWTKLGLKVALKEAVAQGADKIAWTTGEQQNERYDLSKKLSYIQYDAITDEDDNPTGEYVVRYSTGVAIDKELYLDEKGLEDTFGKDIANKIISGEGLENEKVTASNGTIYAGKILEGENLKVGGKGMKGFYGSIEEGTKGIVGGVAEKVFGQKLGKTNIEIGNKSIEAGTGREIKGYKVRLKDGSAISGFETLEEAKEFADRKGGKVEFNTTTQPSIDITPELKAQVEQGQALFQKQQGKAQGQIKFADKVNNFNKAVISLFKTAKADTFIHEFSHLNFQDMLAMAKDNEQIKADVRTTIEFYNQHAKPSERIKNVDEAVEHLLSIDPIEHKGDDTYVKVHEAFANGFSEYLRNENSSIPQALKEVYEVLKQHLKQIAQYIAGAEAKLTPEMEAVYRRLFEPEFVNNLKETANNRQVEREEIERSKPVVKYSEEDIKDAFGNLDVLEQSDRPTPNQIFKSKIAEWKAQKRTDSTFVMEQLNKLVDDLAEGKNKEILKDFLKTKEQEYKELADGGKDLHQRTRTLLENKGLSLEDKERIYKDDNYALVSFIDLQKDVDSAIKQMTYNEVVANEALLKDKLAETTNPKEYVYAETLFNISKVKKGFDYLDELRRSPKKNAKEIERLNERLHKELFALREQGTDAARMLALQKAMDIFTPEVLVENIARERRAARTAEQQQRLKEEVAILKEKIEKGVADTEIHEAIVAELEKTIDDYKADLTELEKQNKQLEDKVKKADERAKQSKIDALKERALGKARNSKDLNIDKKAVEQKKSELKGKIIALLNSNLYSQENPDSPIGVLRSYIENHILEQQSSIAKKVSLKDVLDHFKSEGLPVPTEAVVRAYKEARVNLVNKGVNVKAFDLDADIDLTLEAIEAKAEMERLNEQKKALEKKIKDDEKLSKDIEEKRIAQESKRKEKVERDAKVVSNIISNIEQGLQVPQVSKPKLPQTEFNKIKNYVKTKFGQNLTDDQLDIFLNSNDSSGRNMRDVILDMMQEEKFLNSRDFTNPKIVDKAIATSLKGVRWKDRVVKYDRDAAIKEAVDKVLADNPDLTPEEIANVENRIKQLFKEKEIEWTNAQVKKAERKGQPKKPRDISNNIVKLSNLIATGNFNEEANDLLANELGLGGIDEGQRIKIGEFIDVIQSLPKGKLRNLQIESLSAYIASIANPFMFHHNVWSSTIYTEALANPASSLQNATGLMSTLDKVFTDFLLSGDATYLKNFFNAFTKGGFKSSLSMGLFSSNEHFDLAQSEGGFSPFRGIEYAEKYGGELDSSRRRVLTKWRGLKTKYTGAKLIGRINEGIDAISQFALGENAAYKHVKAKVEKEFPNLTKEQQFEKIKELLYPMTWTEAKRQAIEQIYKTKGYYKNEFPTAAEINAIAFDIMQQARDEDTKAIMARDAQKGTFRNKPSSWVNGGGLMEGISAAYEASYTWAKNQITNAKFSQKRKNALMSTLNVSKILTVMFSRTPANIIEVGSHYGLLGGAFKLASLQSYKKGLKSAKDISLEAEIEYVNQYQKDVAVRMVKGATLLMLMPVIFAMLNEDKDDDELKDGVYGDSKLNPTGIRNSLVIGGKVIPLNFLGGLAPLFAIQGAITDAEREKTEKSISDESIEGDFNSINHITDLTKRWMMSTIKSTPFYGASKQKDMISDFIDGSTEGIGKLIGGQLAFSYLPSPRMINDVSSWKYTKMPQPHGFVQGLMANTYTPALLVTNTAKPMFDYRGREVDIRDRRFMSVGGLFKRLASTPNDNVDNILLNHKIVLPFLNPEKYVINGELLSDRPDDLYVFSKDIADKYNEMLTNDGEPHQYYITNENGKRELQVVHGLKDILNEIDVYKNSSMDELSKLGSVDINADKQLKKQILRNYNIIVKYVMERNGVEDNTYSRYEEEVLTENERQNLFKNKKSLENKLKKQ